MEKLTTEMLLKNNFIKDFNYYSIGNFRIYDSKKGFYHPSIGFVETRTDMENLYLKETGICLTLTP